MPSNKKAVDVAKPGKTAPDSSGRPVIVTHRPMVDDPMVKKEDPKAPAPADPSTSRRVIQPLIAETDTTTTDKPAEPAQPVDPTPEPEKEQAEEAAVVDAVAEQATTSKKKDGELTEEERKKQEEITKLIESKKYFVPIGQVAKRRNKRAGIIVLVLLLVLCGMYLAADAGVITSDMNLPFEVIQD